jgi:hypothetical protein
MFDRCAACGTPYATPAPPLSRGRRTVPRVLAGLVALAVVAGVVALVARAGDERAAERDRSARLVEQERARLTRLQAPHRGSAAQLVPPPGASPARRRAARAALVAEVERAITADAAARARTGEIDGPIAESRCGPLLKDPEAVPDDRVLDRRVGRYDCVAIRADVRNLQGSVAKLGYAFVAALDFDRFTYVWCRNTPAQGERGRALSFVRLDRACLAARGRALGTGYVDVPGS